MAKKFRFLIPITLCFCLSLVVFCPLKASANIGGSSYTNGDLSIDLGFLNVISQPSIEQCLFLRSYDNVTSYPFSGGNYGVMNDSTIARPIKAWVGFGISFTNSNKKMFSGGSELSILIPNLYVHIIREQISGSDDNTYVFTSSILDTYGWGRVYAYLYNYDGTYSLINLTEYASFSSSSKGNAYFDLNISAFTIPSDCYRLDLCVVTKYTNVVSGLNSYIGNTDYNIYSSFGMDGSSYKFTESKQAVSEDVVENIDNNVSGLPGKIAGAISGFFSMLSDTFETVGDFLSSKLSTVSTNITNSLSTLKTNLVNTFNSVGSSITSALSTVKDNIVTMKDNLVSNIVSMKNGITSVLVDVKDGIVGKIQDLFSISEYEDGTLLDGNEVLDDALREHNPDSILLPENQNLPSVDGFVPVANDSFVGVLSSITNQPIVANALLVSFILAFISFVFFGKR